MSTTNITDNSITITTINDDSFSFSDSDFTFETSCTNIDSDITWHTETDEYGQMEFFYTKPIPIIGFKPSKKESFISENNTSKLLLFGVKHGKHS